MSEAFIEFYCDEETFGKFMDTPSFENAKALYSLEAKEEKAASRYKASYILVCHSTRSAMNIIADIRAWMKETYGMNMTDSHREVLISNDDILAQLRKGEFNPDNYFYDYFIKEINRSI